MTPASRSEPRIVLVTRKTQLELLLARHGTLGQVRFYLSSRGKSAQAAEEAHEKLHSALSLVLRSLPPERKRTHVERSQLDRFLFAPDDIVTVVGPDGLVANTSKYLRGQLTIGINPDPGTYDGVLCQIPPRAFPSALGWLSDQKSTAFRIEKRTMAEAQREDGQTLLALNEIFIGHETHQSAVYRLRAGGTEERQSSSGLICATGTGGTGWALSISRQRKEAGPLPSPSEPRLAWFVREPFPSVATSTELAHGSLSGEDCLQVFSEMAWGGVVFADGIESDRLEFLEGHCVTLRLASRSLHLLVPGRI